MPSRVLTALAIATLAASVASAIAAGADDLGDGARAFQRGDAEGAITLLSRALEAGDLSASDNAAAHRGRGIAYSQLGRFEEAIRDFDAFINLAPQSGEGYMLRGMAEESRGRRQQALADLTAAIRVQPDHAESYANRCRVLLNAGRPDEALGSCEDALNFRSDSLTTLAWRGEARFRLARHTDAIRDFDTVLAARPDDAGALLFRGRAKSALRRNEEAISDYTAVIRLRPDNWEGYFDRGIVYNRLERLTEAIADYGEVLRIRPTPIVYNNRCYLLARLNRLDEALSDCERAMELNTANPSTVLDSRGYVYFRMGRYARAIEDFDAALMHRPDLVWSLYGRGVAKLKLMDASGREDMEAAARIDHLIAEKMAPLGVAP
jgi:tetratricopeptide (TPR) repeat protein